MMDSKIVLLGYVIQKFLIENKMSDVRPKDLMTILIEIGYFSKDYKNGLPLRNLLRELDNSDRLYLLPQVRVERKESNRYWYFSPVENI